jgi:hypothetical protein
MNIQPPASLAKPCEKGALPVLAVLLSSRAAHPRPLEGTYLTGVFQASEFQMFERDGKLPQGFETSAGWRLQDLLRVLAEVVPPSRQKTG